MRLFRLAAPVALWGAIFTLGLVAASPASADDSSTVVFTPNATQTAGYGSNWLMTIKVAGSSQYDYVTATSGTVNVLIKGIPGDYATGLPLTPGGLAFFSPPSSKPPLAAGTYSVSAVYVPSGTAYLEPSQTTTPARLTITALNVSSSFSVQQTTVHGRPSLQVVARITSPTTGTARPDGTWQIRAKDSTGAVAFSRTVALASNPKGPITVALGQKVKPGHEYSVSAGFVPAPAVAGGYRVNNAVPKQVTVEAESLTELLSTPFAAPIWLLAAIGIGLALLIAAGIAFLVTTKPKPAAAAPADSIDDVGVAE